MPLEPNALDKIGPGVSDGELNDFDDADLLKNTEVNEDNLAPEPEGDGGDDPSGGSPPGDDKQDQGDPTSPQTTEGTGKDATGKDATGKDATGKDATTTEGVGKDAVPPAGGKKGGRKKDNELIPRNRYNYQRDRAQALEQENRELQARIAAATSGTGKEEGGKDATGSQPTSADLDDQIGDLDVKIEEARADGNAKEAAKLRGQQRKLERQFSDLQAGDTPDPNQISQAAVASMQVNELVGHFEVEYPMINPESGEDYDKELAGEVMDMFESLTTKYDRPTALKRAVGYVMAANEILPASKQKTNSQGRQTDKAKNANAAASQPPELRGAGLEGDKGGVTKELDVMGMNQEQFENLSDDQLDKLLK